MGTNVYLEHRPVIFFVGEESQSLRDSNEQHLNTEVHGAHLRMEYRVFCFFSSSFFIFYFIFCFNNLQAELLITMTVVVGKRSTIL